LVHTARQVSKVGGSRTPIESEEADTSDED
ncbi:MAG: hypothetical protein UU03_C0010G0013, partial [Candidatus Woesebacteria bacterium GW2011_GWA1_40_45]